MSHLGLLQKTFIIAFTMLFFAFVPVLISARKRVSSPFLLLGTGSLLGLVCFDLIPNMLRIGGEVGLLLVVLVWALYSAFHWASHRPAASSTLAAAGAATFQPAPDERLRIRSRIGVVPPFLFSMLLHCFASGVILVVSMRFAPSFSRAFFFAILTHKSFEAVIVSFMLLNQVTSRTRAFALLFIYCATLPLGVALAATFDADLKLDVAKVVSGVGLGTLLGCLQFDFIVPCIDRIRERKIDFAWVVAGFALTEWMMRVSV